VVVLKRVVENQSGISRSRSDSVDAITPLNVIAEIR